MPTLSAHRAILGPAGAGKTTEVRKLKGAFFTSTTGVSTVNLHDAATTIHSLLKFHNTETFHAQQSRFARASIVATRLPMIVTYV